MAITQNRAQPGKELGAEASELIELFDGPAETRSFGGQLTLAPLGSIVRGPQDRHDAQDLALQCRSLGGQICQRRLLRAQLGAVRVQFRGKGIPLFTPEVELGSQLCELALPLHQRLLGRAGARLERGESGGRIGALLLCLLDLSP